MPAIGPTSGSRYRYAVRPTASTRPVGQPGQGRSPLQPIGGPGGGGGGGGYGTPGGGGGGGGGGTGGGGGSNTPGTNPSLGLDYQGFLGRLMDDLGSPVPAGMTPEELNKGRIRARVSARTQGLRDVGSLAARAGGSLDDPALQAASQNILAGQEGQAATASNELELQSKRDQAAAETERRRAASGLGTNLAGLGLGYDQLGQRREEYWNDSDYRERESDYSRDYREREYEDSRSDREEASRIAASERRRADARQRLLDLWDDIPVPQRWNAR